MNTTVFGTNIIASVKKIWVHWEEQYIADSYEDAVDFSRNCGMINSFNDWLDYEYTKEEIFELTENEKAMVKAQYDEYIKNEIADQWEEREITI